MEDLFIFVAGLINGIIAVFCYRLGKRDAQDEKTPEKAILPPKKHKPAPLTEEEKAAIERQRRIDEFRG
jgi:hypothetical protein